MAVEHPSVPDPYGIEPLHGPVSASVQIPGSKSITNRALVCAALADGRSMIRDALQADDTSAMLAALSSLGIGAHRFIGTTKKPNGRHGTSRGAAVEGVAGRVPASDEVVDTRQSGTTSRFILPLLALGSGTYEVTAHPQMQARPMGATFEALRALGLTITELGQPGHLPARITVGEALGRAVSLPGDVSSQFLSGLLMIGPCLPEGLIVRVTTELVSRPYVDLTIAVMASFGAQVDEPEAGTFVVRPTGYQARSYRVEPDASAASYALAAAVIVGGSVEVEGLGEDALQGDAAFADVLGEMGADVRRIAGSTIVGRDPAAALRGGTFDFTHISDTAQTLAVVAPFADSPVTITGIGFIRRKEIDRIAAVATELQRCGIRVDTHDDGWTIHPGTPQPAVIQTYDDHRMAMSFALLGLRVPGIEIAGPDCVAKTFPGYWSMLDALRASARPAAEGIEPDR